MSLESTIQEVIERSAKRIIPITVMQGTVLDVDAESRTCTVQRDEMPKLFDVRLNAVSDPGENVITVFPQVGSRVLAAMVENIKTDCHVLTCDKVDRIEGKIGETTFNITSDGVTINGGNNGGMLVSQKVIDELQSVKDDINKLKQVFAGWVLAPGDGGGALKFAAAEWFAGSLPSPDPGILINTKVKH